MFSDRFEGSATHGSNRLRLNFADRVTPLGAIKDEWDFIENETLRVNIASELQKVHFDILFVNEYNVYYSPEAMTLKHAIIGCASVAEAVLEVAVRLIQDEPEVAAIIESRERVFDEMYTLQLKEFEIPDGSRVVTGVQREVVRSRLDRHTKMDILIRAAQAGNVITPEMAKKLQHLRRFRNRVHIKTVEELEYGAYPAAVTNAMIEILEEFRLVAKAWMEARQHAAGMDDTLIGRAMSTAGNVAELEVHDLVDHAMLGEGVVLSADASGLVAVRFFTDNSVRRLLLPYAPMKKTGVFEPPDEVPF